MTVVELLEKAKALLKNNDIDNYVILENKKSQVRDQKIQ